MKLFLIPLTKQRFLIYAQQLGKATPQTPSLLDRLTSKAAKTWQEWERGDKKWQRSFVEAGNNLLRRISYEEWGLKSIPTLSSRKKQAELREAKIGVVYPQSVISQGDVPSILYRLATERTLLHRSRFWWSVIGMPIVAPFALVPVIPNVPFFYLAFRAYSHWKALEGGKHLKFLVENNLLVPVSSEELSTLYTRNRMGDIKKQGAIGNINSESLLIDRADAQTMACALQAPGLIGELERAHDQVKSKLLGTKVHQHNFNPKEKEKSI